MTPVMKRDRATGLRQAAGTVQHIGDELWTAGVLTDAQEFDLRTAERLILRVAAILNRASMAWGE